jgi:hypothetical protein
MEQQGRVLDGNLETLGLQATLKMLALGGKTGILSVTSGQERIAIFLENGHIIDLEEPGSPASDLVDMFRLLRRVPRQQASELRRLSGGNPNTAMAVMVQLGLMPPSEVQQRVEFHVIQAISRAVRWERGRFEFHREVSAIQGRLGVQTPLNVDHILLEALRMADEWTRAGALAISRNTVARWMPEFNGDVTQLGLGRDEISVLCLSNGQFPLQAIAYALLMPEPQVAATMHKLLDLGLIEVVDSRLEAELERSLTNLLTQSQHQLSQDSRATPEQRMITLVRTMATCVNGLLTHHSLYARALRGRGEVAKQEVVRYLESTFGPALSHLQRDFPRMDAIVCFVDGRIDYHDLETLDRVVRGQELSDCYWDAVRLFSQFMRIVFDCVLTDEVGKSRAGRQYEDLWAVFLREIDEELTRLSHRRAAHRVQSERAERFDRVAQSRGSGVSASYAYEVAPDSQRRFR